MLTKTGSEFVFLVDIEKCVLLGLCPLRYVLLDGISNIYIQGDVYKDDS